MPCRAVQRDRHRDSPPSSSRRRARRAGRAGRLPPSRHSARAAGPQSCWEPGVGLPPTEPASDPSSRHPRSGDPPHLTGDEVKESAVLQALRLVPGGDDDREARIGHGGSPRSACHANRIESNESRTKRGMLIGRVSLSSRKIAQPERHNGKGVASVQVAQVDIPLALSREQWRVR